MVIKESVIKKMVKEKDRRIAKEALQAIDARLVKLIEKMIGTHNGGKKTIDTAVVTLTMGA